MKCNLRVKRKFVDWYSLRLELGDPEVEYYYWLKSNEPKFRKLSHQRKSYYALKHIYGIKRLEAYRLSGVWL